jgi:glycosyltransferase involved in cell wall biosynthesis
VYASVVIPTYNRKLILQKCLRALERQSVPAGSPLQDYEVVVVDDGSTDGTSAWLASAAPELPHVRTQVQANQGPAVARNQGVRAARGDTIVFIDSDLVVVPQFLHAHALALVQASSARAFTYGRVVNTSNFADPMAEPYKLTDVSAAYFATGNVVIARAWLERAGLFDTRFQHYGWEDLELGVRLKQLGLKLIKCPQAVGYHWHPPFRLEQIPALIEREVQRGRMGVLFYRKHPTWQVRLMVQMTPLHRCLWGLLSLGGRLNERTMAPLLQWLIARGRSGLAHELARIFLNWYCVQAVYAERARQLRSAP